ncbi:MAG TPA: radical SAM protein [Bryobacteraceae bacterium]|nr:radical SAM protein [Bryobacteraceae bacterium]
MSAPSYIRLLNQGELERRVSLLEARLASCDICPWLCRVNRLAGESKVCVSKHLPVVSACAPHFGEEPALSGANLGEAARGTGNIFLGHCNLRCVYCQNWQISQDLRPEGRPGEVSFDELAGMMLSLEAKGCHNIGFVSPTHWTPQIVRAVELAARRGLSIPLIYNTNGYDSCEVLRLLEGIIDIYLPDLRYADEGVAREYSRTPNYVQHARESILEMHRQVGPGLETDEQGIVRRGLIIRLLILPNDLAGLRETLQWIRDALSPRVTLSVMSQYYPTHKVDGEAFPLLSRRIRQSEYEKVLGWLEEFGFDNGWIQPFEAGAADYYRPDFSNRSLPFADARDFTR